SRAAYPGAARQRWGETQGYGAYGPGHRIVEHAAHPGGAHHGGPYPVRCPAASCPQVCTPSPRRRGSRKRQSMESLLQRELQARRPTVLVVGDVMCDVYLWGTVHRVSTEAPVPIFESTGRHQVLGGAANVAANLRALGCEVRLLGVVGADAAGRCVRELL